MGRGNRLGLYELGDAPELADLFRVALRKLKLEIRTMVPATIVVYDPARQVATLTVDHLQTVAVIDEVQAAKLLASGATIEGVPPNAEATLPPVQLVDVPVAWPRTNLGYLTFPLNPGDTGQLVCSDRSLDQWLTKGIPSDPVLASTHLLENGVFEPGLKPTANPIVPPTDQTATVVEGATGVKLGRNASDFVALASLVLAQLQAMQNAFNTHTHTAPSGGGPTTTPTTPMPAPGSVAATKVRAE